MVHSSGALILTGTSGYVAGTIGATATAVAAAPFVIAVGLVIGGSVITLELVCANANHPNQVAKVRGAADEFKRRFNAATSKASVAASSTRETIMPVVGKAAVATKSVATDIWQYVYRRGT